MNYDAYGNPLPQYEQNVTMTNPGPTGPITQNAWSQEFATPETAQRLAALTGGQAVARTPSVGSFSTGTQQMLNYGGSDINAGLAANNAAQYGSAPGSYGSYLNARDAATSQGKPAPANPWDNPNVDTNTMNLYQQRAQTAPIGMRYDRGQYLPVYPWDQDQRIDMRMPSTMMSPGQITAQQYAAAHPEDSRYSGQYKQITQTMGKPLQATTTPGYQNPQQPSGAPSSGSAPASGGAPGTSTQANSMAGAQAAVGSGSGYTGTIGNQTFKNGVLQPDSATAGGASNYEQQMEPYKQQFRPDVQPGQRNVGSYGNYGQYRSQQGGYGQQRQFGNMQQQPSSSAPYYGQQQGEANLARMGQGSGNWWSPASSPQTRYAIGSQGSQSPYGGWAQPQRMGYGNYGQQSVTRQPTPGASGGSNSSF